MLARGDRSPDVELWDTARNRVALAELVRERPALLLFYLFDWSST